MDKRIYNYKEVYDSAVRTGMNDSPSFARFGDLFTEKSKFTLRSVPLAVLHYHTAWNPSMVMNYHEDETGAQDYAKKYSSSEGAEPIICTSKFDIGDGLHRSRAAFIRGETHIMAYVEVEE